MPIVVQERGGQLSDALHFVSRSILQLSQNDTPSDFGNGTCDLLLDDKNLKTGKIPQLLGLSLAVWLVRINCSID